MSLVRVVWGGNFYGADAGGTAIDEWSCSLSLVTATDPDMDFLSGAVPPIMKSYHTNSGMTIGARAAIEYVKVNEWEPGPPFHQITDPTKEVLYTSSNRGSVLSNTTPPFVALKVSLDNGTRNRRTKGGFYVPMFSAALSQNGQYSSTITNSVRDTTIAMLGDLLVLAEVVSIGVWSRADGGTTAVTRVRVGSVPDVIRRRKNAIPEVYSTGSI